MLTGIIVGLFIGFTLGFFACAILTVAKRSDEQSDAAASEPNEFTYGWGPHQ